MSEIIILLMFVGLLVGLATGHPIAFVLGGVGTMGAIAGWGDAAFNIFVTRTFDTMNNYSLVAIPLFVLMANFLTWSNVAEGLFDSIRYLFGPVRGGLAVAVIVVSTVFAATTGIVGASVVTMGLLGLPVLLKHGYQKELSTGVVCAGGSLGILIPPSIMLVIMGTYAQLSVGKLFLAAIIPGITLALLYVVYILFICWKNPDMGPGMSPEEVAEVPFAERIKGVLINLIPPLVLIIGVLGSIFAGIATPTEAAGMGAFFAMLMTIFYKKFNLKMLRKSMEDTAKTTAMCFVILIGANAFTSIFMALQGADIVQNLVYAVGLGKWGVLALMLIISFILGMFIDWIAIVMIVFPIFLPILDSFGFDRLWIAGLNAVLLQTCFLTPPFGYALFYIRGIVPEGVTIGHIYKGVIPFIIIILVMTVLAIVFPEIVLWLPNKFAL